ncbi:unnamed protein product [Ixodes hexagonus]
MGDSRVMPVYEVISGLRLANFYPPYAVKSGLEYQPKESDVFLVTYPQCGTLWMQQVLYLIYQNGSSPKDAIALFQGNPLLELEGSETIEAMPQPGVITSHLSYDSIPKSSEAKYIVLVRDPRDVCATMFRRLQSFPAYAFSNGILSDFVDQFCKDDVDYRGYFSHVRSWYDHKDDSNVFWVTYEEMSKNFAEVVTRLVKFLGEEKKITKNKSLVKKIQEKSSVSYMKSKTNKYMEEFYYIPFEKLAGDMRLSEGVKSFHASVQCSGVLEAMTNVRCVKQGKVGVWKSILSQEDAKKITDRTELLGPEVVNAICCS